MPAYTFHRNGSVRGEVTGQMRSYTRGGEIEAPEGEFEGLPDSAYEQVGGDRADFYNDRAMEAGGTWALGEHKGGGYYYARYGGERAGGDDPITFGVGKEEAQTKIDQLNEKDVAPSDLSSAS